MWRRRTLAISLACIPRTLTRRRALRVGIACLIGVLSLMWAHGSLTVSVAATSTATPLGVGQNFGGRLVTAANQLRISPKVATTAGDALVAIVEVRRNSGLTTVSNISDGSGDVWFRATSVHNAQTPLAGIPMQRESISPAEQHYLAAHPVNPDDPT